MKDYIRLRLWTTGPEPHLVGHLYATVVPQPPTRLIYRGVSWQVDRLLWLFDSEVSDLTSVIVFVGDPREAEFMMDPAPWVDRRQSDE